MECFDFFDSTPSVGSTPEITFGKSEINANVYPNPFVNTINIQSSEQIESIYVYQIDGTLLYTESIVETGNITVAIDNKLPLGTYILELKANDKTSIHRITKIN